MTFLRRTLLLFVASLGLAALPAAAAPVLKVLFLGDNGHHRPAERLRTLAPVMIDRGIHLVYTEDLAALTLQHLARYDAVLIYANIDTIAPEPARALLDYVAQGGGLVPLHSASYCFRNSPEYIALVGGQFQRHAAISTFRTHIVAPDHPVMQGFAGFESTDEPYVHTKHNTENRTVLEMRDDEPYTWVRTHGQGRVFYTAWGHDDRTWSNPGFHDLVERGIRFAAGQKLPDALDDRPAIASLELVDQAGIPYYPPGLRTQGDGVWPKMQKPLSPAESMQRLIVPAGFEIQLVAAEPQIRKPIAMNWDERGRLWIAESLDYPNRLLPRGQPGRDRLVICEDTDRDGRMDKFTVFADGLNIPTSFAFANGGVLVHQQPYTIFLRDDDGDDRADFRETVLRGWGRGDTHAGPNNLVYGHDNWIWGMLGYSGFEGTVGGEAFSFRQGFYRFRPDGSQLEFLRATNNNTWGIGFTEEGYVFASTANNNPSVYLPIPNRYYEPAGLEAKTLGTIADTSRFVALTSRVRQVDVHWGYTAAAGHAFYTARSFPKHYWNRVAFVTEPTGHLVGQFNVQARGADFDATNPTNLIASDDEWFAPIMAEVGPDGAVWVIDWYNYIIQHNPTPKGFERGAGNAYENELRDQSHGRIYRIVWKEGQPSRQHDLSQATPAELLAALANDNLFWRRHAQRLLVERGRKDVVPALLDLVRNQSVDEIGLNAGAIHALWTLHGLHALDTDAAALSAALDALSHPSAGVRRTAIAILPRSLANGSALLEAGVLEDPDAQVRLATLLALAETPNLASAGARLRAAIEKPGVVPDRWSLDAAKMAAATHRATFLEDIPADRIARAREAEAAAARSVLENGSFESADGSMPSGWSLSVDRGAADVALSEVAREGARSVQLSAAAPGAVASLAAKLPVNRNHRYELTGWIRPDNLVPAENGFGALIVVALQGSNQRFNSRPVQGRRDWMPVRINFDTGAATEIAVQCQLGGGGGPASGTALFDDLSLVDLGPSDGSIQDPFSAVLAHVAQRVDDQDTPRQVSDTGNAPIVLELGVIRDAMKYNRTELTVPAGQNARLVFRNTDHMQHNVLILRPGTIEAVGTLADQMLSDPQALAKHYVPLSGDVLFHTPLVDPGDSYELNFIAPSQPGRYPFVCTFPGHWRIMQGVLVVTP